MICYWIKIVFMGLLSFIVSYVNDEVYNVLFIGMRKIWVLLIYVNGVEVLVKNC